MYYDAIRVWSIQVSTQTRSYMTAYQAQLIAQCQRPVRLDDCTVRLAACSIKPFVSRITHPRPAQQSTHSDQTQVLIMPRVGVKWYQLSNYVS